MSPPSRWLRWPPPEGAACKPTKTDDEEAKTLYGLAVKAEDTSITDVVKQALKDYVKKYKQGGL